MILIYDSILNHPIPLWPKFWLLLSNFVTLILAAERVNNNHHVAMCHIV